MFLRKSPPVYVVRSHGPLRGPLTALLLLWTIAYPGLLLLLAALGPVGFVLGIGAAVLLFVPWATGLVILMLLRWFS